MDKERKLDIEKIKKSFELMRQYHSILHSNLPFEEREKKINELGIYLYAPNLTIKKTN